jgi:hypothetical protein
MSQIHAESKQCIRYSVMLVTCIFHSVIQIQQVANVELYYHRLSGYFCFYFEKPVNIRLEFCITKFTSACTCTDLITFLLPVLLGD